MAKTIKKLKVKNSTSFDEEINISAEAKNITMSDGTTAEATISSMKTDLNGKATTQYVDTKVSSYKVPNANTSVVGGLKARLDGDTLYLTNNGKNA